MISGSESCFAEIPIPTAFPRVGYVGSLHTLLVLKARQIATDHGAGSLSRSTNHILLLLLGTAWFRFGSRAGKEDQCNHPCLSLAISTTASKSQIPQMKSMGLGALVFTAWKRLLWSGRVFEEYGLGQAVLENGVHLYALWMNPEDHTT